MILRKPYAFLIKHFKMIHLILTVLYIYLVIHTNNILRYYNNFLSGTESKLNAINYVNNIYLIIIALSIAICLIIFLLMRYKKKPKLLYIILIIFYIISAVIINIAHGGLEEIYIASLEVKTIRLYRDLLRIIVIFQYIAISISLVRGLGFDIKKFNFKEDISELQLDITDDEEIELTLGATEGLERKIRRRIRETIYYYKENKFMILTTLATLTIISIFYLTINHEVINKVYNEGESVTTDAFIFTVKGTYLTNQNSQLRTINTDNTSYVLVKLTVSPKTKNTKLNTANIILKAGNNNYSVKNVNYSNFKDLGTEYNNRIINSTSTYLFAFHISNNDKNKKMQLIYAQSKKIALSPEDLDSKVITKNYKLKETLSLSKSPLSSGKLTIKNYQISNKFSYKYTYEINDKNYTGNMNIKSVNNTIIKLNITSSSFPSNLTLNDLIAQYGTIIYKINDEEKETTILNNKTPGSISNKLYLEVDKEVENATSIYLQITIRNRKFNYQIK